MTVSHLPLAVSRCWCILTSNWSVRFPKQLIHACILIPCIMLIFLTSGRSNSLWKKVNNLAWVHAFLWSLPYLKQFSGRILGTKLPLMFRAQLRHMWEESTQTYTYKEVRAEACAPGIDSLVYFQLLVGTQQWGLVQNQSSFFKRIVERTPQPCPFNTQSPQARRPWKQTKAQLKEQHPAEESRDLQKHLIKFRSAELIAYNTKVEKATIADCVASTHCSTAGKKEQRERWSNGTAHHVGCSKFGVTQCSRCQKCWHTRAYTNLQGDGSDSGQLDLDVSVPVHCREWD